MAERKLHVAMFPWFAFGHLNAFLHLSNQLAKRGHKVSFLLPNKGLLQLQSSNLYPSLITFYALSVPDVEGIPPGTETCSEIPVSLTCHLATAFDLTRPQVGKLLLELRPDFVLYDFSHWVPEFAKEIGFKSVYYCVVCAASQANVLVPGREHLTAAEMADLPPGYPSTTVVLRPHEARVRSIIPSEYGRGITFYGRLTAAMSRSDAIAIRTCKETEGMFCDFVANQYQKPVLLTGPVLPESAPSPLEDRWRRWLDRFDRGSVLFCAFGSQEILERAQFQELVLGFELTGLPFLIALKPPRGAATVQEALPEGFEERVGERGVVHGGWVQQVQVLKHQSVGCFVSHCGFGSMWESLMSESQIVLVPHYGDQILNARLLAGELKVAVEVERDEVGWFSKEGLCEAIRSVMDKGSEVGSLVKKNHGKWRETLLSPGFMSNYVDQFVQKLYEL